MRLPSKKSNAFSGRPDAASCFMAPVTNVATKHIGVIDHLEEAYARIA
jgi:hypothetical protein